MGDTFPELEGQREYVERVIRAEEESFLATLEPGVEKFKRFASRVKQLQSLRQSQPDILTADPRDPSLGDHSRLRNAHLTEFLDEVRKDRDIDQLLRVSFGDEIVNPEIVIESAAMSGLFPGEIAFVLHDTYGFPADLTALMAREEGLEVDMVRFDELMTEQRERARAAAGFSVDQSQIDLWSPTSEAHTQGGKPIDFAGYDTLNVRDARVLKTRRVGDDEKQRYELVLNRTPFYAESGGQIGDTGTLVVGDQTITVLDTQKQQGEIVHVVDALPHDLDAPVTAQVDVKRRARIAKHHTVTHLLHAGLREVLGSHVQQKGSLVAPEKLRFDFSHFERVTPEELRAVEDYVNGFIQDNVQKQEDRDVPIDEAMTRGAMALFGEKYGDKVRVITFDASRSVELCGGTHVGATGDIGVFRFLSEGSVAAGVRRVEAVAGIDAVAHLWHEIDELSRVRGLFRNLSSGADAEIEKLIEQNKTLEKALEATRRASLESHLDGFARNAVAVGDARLATGRLDGAGMDALRDLAQTLADRLGDNGAALLVGADETGEKAMLAMAVSEALVKRGAQAGKLVGVLAKKVGGGGGGRPTLATAGGRDASGLDDVLASAPALLAEALV